MTDDEDEDERREHLLPPIPPDDPRRRPPEERYRAWIAENVTQPCGGMCKVWSRKMSEVFPELTLTRGYYRPHGGHWWLTAPDGAIVDPTIQQFEDDRGEYLPVDESKPQPTGKCPGCGGLVFAGETFCCRECADDTLREWGMPPREAV